MTQIQLGGDLQTDKKNLNEKAPAPELILPENLKAVAGTALKEIELPENWTWVNGDTMLSEEISGYAARLAVDDETYDYMAVEGYQAEGHYVERMVPVALTEAKPTEEQTEKSTIATIQPSILVKSALPTPRTGDIGINETTFPDETFRNYIKKVKDKDSDGSLSATEIAGVTEINVKDKTAITSLKGIEYFTALKELNCNSTGITSLDVSSNTALTTLNCYETRISELKVIKNTALTTLNCNNTGITSLDVSSNTALKELYCYNTGITSLNVSNNTALTTLDCNNTGITSLDVSSNTALTTLDCYETRISELKVIKNTALTTLNCSNTRITSLDVSKNDKLQLLNCISTGITSLNVSNNSALINLNCSTTGITSLNVSNNKALKYLYCYSTGITSLDVSNNKALKYLYCESCPLAWLNIGNNDNLTTFDKPDPSSVELTLTANESTFEIAKKYTGIDLSKISNVQGATYANGVFSNYSASTPITYDYECGSSKDVAQTLNVEITLKGFRAASSISITADLDKTYDGNAVSSTPTVTKTGSTGVVSYKWEKKNADNSWTKISKLPTDAGDYRVTATVAEDDNYQAATSDSKEFTISKADSSITIEGDLSKDYDGNAVSSTPTFTKTGSTGVVSYKWEKKNADNSWTEISKLPTDAGDYRVTATVAADDNYQAATSDSKEFTISKADSSITIEGDLSKDYDGNAVSSTPTFTKTGSTGVVSYKWEKKNADNSWTEISKLPTDAGDYRVTVSVVADDNYQAATSDSKEFTISKADSSITIEGDLSKDYDGNAVSSKPTVTKTGSTRDVSYKWEKKNADNSWTEISESPTDAGDYRVTATVAADDNYQAATSDSKEFTIAQATPSYTVPTGLQANYGQTLQKITLPDGFAWSDTAASVGSVGKNSFTVIYTPKDTTNYQIVTDITVTVTVAKASNEQTTALTLDNWTYGTAPSMAASGFRFGLPRYLYSDQANGTFKEEVPTTAGTWYVKAVVDGTKDYEGIESEAVSFVIEQKNAAANNQISVENISAETNLEHLTLKDGEKVLVEGMDYEVIKIASGNQVTVTISFKGNYTGTITKTYALDDKKPNQNTNTVDQDKNKDQNSDKNKAVKTGDISNTSIWAMLLAFAGSLVAMLGGKKRKEEEEN